MRKHNVIVITLIVIMGLGLVSIPNAFCQVNTGNAKVLSYSWYLNANGDFIVVGEVQNIGTSILSFVALNATVFATDGTQLVTSAGMAYGADLVSQQKAPFYIDLGNPGTGTSLTSEVGHIDFTVTNAPTTNTTQYSRLALISGFNGIEDGIYLNTGFVFNNGTQTANDIRVTGTYYNSSGDVIAVGFNNVTSPLTPNNATGFEVGGFDETPTLIAEISNYSLMVQTSTLNGTVISTSPTPSASSTPLLSGSLMLLILGTVAVIVVVAVVALAFLRKRRSMPPPPPPPPPPPAAQTV